MTVSSSTNAAQPTTVRPAPSAAAGAAAAPLPETAGPAVQGDNWGHRAARIATGSDSSGAALTAAQIESDMKIGVLTGIPMELVTESQNYRINQTSASQYLGTVVSQSIGFGMWTVGGALAAAATAGFAMPAIVTGIIGFTAGMVACDIWDRTFGRSLQKTIGDRLPNKIAKPIADFCSKYIANPIYDHIWTPLKNAVLNHKVLACVLMAVAGLRYPKAAWGLIKFGITMFTGSLAAMGIGKYVTSHILPAAPTVGTGIDDGEKAMVGIYNEASAAATKAGKSAPQADAAGKTALVQALVKEKVSATDAANVANQMATEAHNMGALVDMYTTAFEKFKKTGANKNAADAAAQRFMIDQLTANHMDLPVARQMVVTAVEMYTAKQKAATAPAKQKPASHTAPAAATPAANHTPAAPAKNNTAA